MDNTRGISDLNFEPMQHEQPLLIGIAGPSGSGKTTLARQLAELMGDQRALVLSLDSYYRDLSHLSMDERSRQNFDEPSAIDDELLIHDLLALANGLSIDVPCYDFESHSRSTETRRVESRSIVIVEGLFTLAWERVRKLLDMSVFVDVNASVCLSRRIDRDTKERGRTVESVRQQFEQVLPMAERWILPTADHANFVIDGTIETNRLACSLANHVNTRVLEDVTQIRKSTSCTATVSES